jgi:hypothetical protein
VLPLASVSSAEAVGRCILTKWSLAHVRGQDWACACVRAGVSDAMGLEEVGVGWESGRWKHSV